MIAFVLVQPAQKAWEGHLHVMRKPVEPEIRTTHMGHSVNANARF
jgi:hypothetical protein